jgi:glycosyltransferase involved in cell wall biosynthesis
MTVQDDDVWIVIPAYNEAPVIADTLKGVGRSAYHILVVDDGSTDDTSRVALPHVNLLCRHLVNLGQGAALQTGLRVALLHGAAFIVTFDADGQHQPDDIDQLLAPLQRGESDVALGSRFLPGARTESLPWLRKAVLRIAAALTRLSTGLALTDTHNGLRAFSRHAASRISIRQNGMAHASEILMQIAYCRLSYVEIPVTIEYTEYSLGKGQSIFNALDIAWALLIRSSTR